MTDLVRYQAAALDRRTARAAARLQTQTSLELARVRAIETIECAKVEAIDAVASLAIIAGAHISVVEAMECARSPHAAARLKLLADGGTFALAGRVDRLNRVLQ